MLFSLRAPLPRPVLHTLGMMLAISASLSTVTAGQDWPMWRYDAQRTAASPGSLPNDLQPLWQRQLGPRQPAWDDPLNIDLMTYDRVFEPIVMGGRLFVGFNDQDKLVAYDASTGQELWTVYADAPVRLPPVGWQGQVYFCSDDGNLYCVDANDGSLCWKYQAAPNDQHAIGNQRLTSAWPARGGPVVRDGTVYFAASIWPFMGTFIYALDAQTGEVRWVNDSTGAQYIKQPHSAPSFAGVAPQGALVATDSLLIVPGGRSVPAVFDRQDGQLRYFELNAGGKGTGGSFVAADDRYFYVHTRIKGTRAFNLADGIKTAFMPNEPVLANGVVYSAELAEERPVVRAYGTEDQQLWEIEADGSGDLILVGQRLIAAGEDSITVIQLPTADQPPRIVKSVPVSNPVERLIAADEKLFAVTLTGDLLAFGDPSAAADSSPRSLLAEATGGAAIDVDQRDHQQVEQLLASDQADGYALWYGDSESSVLAALADRSPFHQLAVVDSNPERVNRTRKRLDAAGRYGRITAHAANPQAFAPPSFIANMVFVSAELSALADHRQISAMYQAVRPYGGEMHLLADGDQSGLAERIGEMNLEQAQVEIGDHGVIVRRAGRLPGSADWTHQYGDIANTIKSDDARVKLPLGVLWFGGSSNMDVLPRHGHGPPEQVLGGRLFIQGMNSLSARDVYTGRVLWKREFHDLGTYDVYYDDTYEDVPLDPKYNQVHIPGANGRGTNYVVTDEYVYLIENDVCHALDPATGQTIRDFHLPTPDSGEPVHWGYIGVYEDVLIGGLGFAQYAGRHDLEFELDEKLKGSKAGFASKSLDRAASLALVGFDRHSGQQLWQIDANHSFWHNGIVAGGKKIYCLDRNPQQVEDALRRRGRPRPDTYRIAAFDYRTGQMAWEFRDGIFGTWLGYSEEYDLLLQAGAKASDRLVDEIGQGMAVYSAADGSLRWRNDDLNYSGPCILHNDLIITNANSYSDSAGAFYLQTGKQKLTKNPLTGQLQPWKITRAYGCNSIVASENLLTFRSGAAGFYDLISDSGTGNLGGFKSGCTSNLIVANGVLNAPDYTRTCSCAYQNQTSLALVHMPDIDQWSIHTAASTSLPGERIEQLGLNFGAPGDRRDANGLLWIEHPVVSEPSPPIKVVFNPQARFYQNHSSSMSGESYPWIVASGVHDVSEVKISLQLESDPAPDAEDSAADAPASEGTAASPSKTDRQASSTTDPSDGNPAADLSNPQLSSYDIRLFFPLTTNDSSDAAIFDVYLQGQCILQDVSLAAPDGSSQKSRIERLESIPIDQEFHLKFVPKQGVPALCGIELVRHRD